MVQIKTFKGSKSGQIIEGITNKQLGPTDVLVRVTHSGLCGTDVHYKSMDMVLGHEGVGVVEEVGPDVTLFKTGNRVGWGYQHDACGHCRQCLRGRETYCEDRKLYGEADLDQGSMASHAVWKQDFLFMIPDELSSTSAAPLQCGGATVWTVLSEYDVKPRDRVGVVGVGGLGHLAISFAAAMGCEVVVFSSTESKKKEALQLGAKEFHATSGIKELKTNGNIDHLIVTTSSQPDWDLFLNIMEPGGTVFPLSVSQDALSLPYMTVLLKGLRVQGSLVATRQAQKDMLQFAARHDINPITQTFELSQEGIIQAFKTLEKGSMRYRGVLVAG